MHEVSPDLLKNPLFLGLRMPLLSLAPMAGYTNLPFRILIREMAGGVGITTTELVNARSLIERHREALKLIELSEADKPCAIQLFSGNIDEMCEAARICEAAGAAAVDINMGCPARKVVNNGGGSALLSEPEHAIHLAEKMVDAIHIPITVKMRLGPDPEHFAAAELARRFQEVGVRAITIHGRRRSQGFSGVVDPQSIKAVVEAAPQIPVLANGDITTVAHALLMLNETNCSGLAIGRGAFYNPWIFSGIRKALVADDAMPEEPSFEMRFEFMTRHLQLMVEHYGEESACSQFRKIAPFYTRRMGPSREVNRQLCQCATLARFHEIMADYRQYRQRFLDENGELLPKYRPLPIASTLDS